MRIKMKTLAAGPDRTLVPDGVYVLPHDQAQDLVDGGYAEQVDSSGNPIPGQPRRHPGQPSTTATTATTAAAAAAAAEPSGAGADGVLRLVDDQDRQTLYLGPDGDGRQVLRLPVEDGAQMQYAYVTDQDRAYWTLVDVLDDVDQADAVDDAGEPTPDPAEPAGDGADSDAEQAAPATKPRGGRRAARRP